MPMQDNTPATLEYETAQPQVPWATVVFRHAPTACWGVALILHPVFALAIVPSMRRTSGSTDPQIYALQWAIAAIALRAAIALLCRERTWWSLLYIALYFVLPFVADVTAKWWRSAGT